MMIKRIVRFVGGVAVLATLALVIANGSDYFKFQRAIARVENLTETEKQEIGDFCRTPKQHIRFEAADTPPALARLKPLKGSLYPGNTDLLLYERGEVDLWARIDTSRHNQTILYFTNSSGPQKSKVIWRQTSDYPGRPAPTGRKVTIHGPSRTGDTEWIVLADRITAGDLGSFVGGEPVVYAETPLSHEALQSITAALEATKRFGGGSDFRCDSIMDGYWLHLYFTSDGSSSPDDIDVSNVVVPEISPLLDLISKFGPKDYPIDFDERIRERGEQTTTRRTLAEREKMGWPTPKTPWWCVWRNLVY